MKRKISYTRSPYKKRGERELDYEELSDLVTELRHFKERIITIFDTSRYKTRIIESVQREIDVLEKHKKRKYTTQEEIQILKDKIEQLEARTSNSLDISKLLEDIEIEYSAEKSSVVFYLCNWGLPLFLLNKIPGFLHWYQSFDLGAVGIES